MSAQMIDKDELTGAAVLLGSALCLMQSLTEDYFVKFNPENDKDKFGIVWEFDRYRAFAQAVYGLLFSIQKEFEKNDITPYD